MVEEVYNSISVFTKVPRPASSIGVLSEGQGCIALFSEDQEWYRAVIQNINTESAEVLHVLILCIHIVFIILFFKVLFIDFGNTTQCLPHAIINKMACPSIPGLAISFNEVCVPMTGTVYVCMCVIYSILQHKHLKKDLLSCLLDKELVVKKVHVCT